MGFWANSARDFVDLVASIAVDEPQLTSLHDALLAAAPMLTESRRAKIIFAVALGVVGSGMRPIGNSLAGAYTVKSRWLLLLTKAVSHVHVRFPEVTQSLLGSIDSSDTFLVIGTLLSRILFTARSPNGRTISREDQPIGRLKLFLFCLHILTTLSRVLHVAGGELCCKRQKGPEANAIADTKLQGPRPHSEFLKCSICMDPDCSYEPSAGKCGHVFCWSCIHMWILSKPGSACPVCLCPLSSSDVLAFSFG